MQRTRERSAEDRWICADGLRDGPGFAEHALRHVESARFEDALIHAQHVIRSREGRATSYRDGYSGILEVA